MLPILLQPQENLQKTHQHTAATEKQHYHVKPTTLSHTWRANLHVQTHIKLPALFLNGVHPVEQSVYSSFNVTTRESEGIKYKSSVDTQQHVSLLHAHF